MASNSDYPQPTTAATYSGRAGYYLIEELNWPVVDHNKIRNEASGDVAMIYHKLFDEIRDAYKFADKGRNQNADALEELLALGAHFKGQVGPLKSLRDVHSRAKMVAIRNHWQAFCGSKGAAMKTLYGIEKQAMWLFEGRCF